MMYHTTWNNKTVDKNSATVYLGIYLPYLASWKSRMFQVKHWACSDRILETLFKREAPVGGLHSGPPKPCTDHQLGGLSSTYPSSGSAI
ncbi:hypothetical protein BO94DRAFT_184381 [Aspergillus sclerotioniger CBS 115572]|uniref:Uncharacterized protein n=1 Tax=Aspergillus sclerotioniger CBS 115572 TaxID=1450535 RepID=A0A317VYK8_9EURO|nr:hypothetical protein BO94DRAFT_184381 [Aspergillus sclerotioniger CBS 115572]PWY78047.1 hypothetical protein BO94DRAFT_184381 [Aspergillus sclerotioniger CBS 115572]